MIFGGAVAVAGTLMRRTAGETIIDRIELDPARHAGFHLGIGAGAAFAVAIPVLPLTGRIDPELAEGFTTRFYLAESTCTGRFIVAADIMRHMAMPTLALALPLAAVIVRLLKQSLKEAMLQDYVLLARIKGFRELRLVLQEALRNAVGPTLALTGVQFTFLIGGTVIVERIFAYPGIGNLAIDAVINRDFPLIQGLVLLFGLIFILINIGVISRSRHSIRDCGTPEPHRQRRGTLVTNIAAATGHRSGTAVDCAPPGARSQSRGRGRVHSAVDHPRHLRAVDRAAGSAGAKSARRDVAAGRLSPMPSPAFCSAPTGSVATCSPG